jgi:dTDP-4-amino-4,6-dideoxygalactose transaminase
LNGRPAGGWGDLGCFSLHPLKNLHAYGDGGIITTNDEAIKDLLVKARNHGLVNREQCEFWSYNCRLDEMQAALLRVQMRYLHQWTEARRHLAFRYNDLLRPYVEVPDEGPGERCVYQTYAIKADRRDDLKAFLNQQGVEALIHYATPIHLQPAAKSLGYGPQDFPVTMRHVARIMSLPLYPSLSHDEQDRVAQLIGQFYREIR